VDVLIGRLATTNSHNKIRAIANFELCLVLVKAWLEPLRDSCGPCID